MYAYLIAGAAIALLLTIVVLSSKPKVSARGHRGHRVLLSKFKKRKKLKYER